MGRGGEGEGYEACQETGRMMDASQTQLGERSVGFQLGTGGETGERSATVALSARVPSGMYPA